jgi:four helix bundle protein
MEQPDWTLSEKPYDLRERLFLFACVIVRLVQYLHTRGPVAKALSYQLLKSGTSAGANYEEADGGSSGRDKLAKKRSHRRA